jgi:hypothetical protein
MWSVSLNLIPVFDDPWGQQADPSADRRQEHHHHPWVVRLRSQNGKSFFPCPLTTLNRLRCKAIFQAGYYFLCLDFHISNILNFYFVTHRSEGIFTLRCKCVSLLSYLMCASARRAVYFNLATSGSCVRYLASIAVIPLAECSTCL